MAQICLTRLIVLHSFYCLAFCLMFCFLLFNFSGGIQSILLGELDFSTESDDATPQTYGVSRVIVHPQYRSESTYNDIMLVELDRKVEFSLYIRPLCLQTKKTIPGTKGIASGWGRLEAGKTTSPTCLQHKCVC